MPQDTIWTRFRLDPRLHTHLRAADEDRDLVRECLSEAFADGRLDREELDERLAAVGSARRLGDLLGPLADLVLDAHPIEPDSQEARDLEAGAPPPAAAHLGPGTGGLSRSTHDDPLEPPVPQTHGEIDLAAREHYAKLVRSSLGSFAGASAITTLVWLAVGLLGDFSFFWPLFVILGTGINVVSLLSSRSRLIDQRRRRLTRQAKEQRALGGGSAPWGGGTGPESRSDERRELRRKRNRGDDRELGDGDERG